MPTVNDSYRAPRRGRSPGRVSADWALPLIRIGGVQIYLSYAVFFAAAGLLLLSVSIANRTGNDDLARSVAVGTSVWVGGWLIQLLAAAVARWVCGLRIQTITIGLIGLETRPHAWSAPRTLAYSVGVMGSLLAAAIGIWLVGDHFGGGQATGALFDLWQSPSLGFTSADAVLHAAAWLLGVQMVCQLFPLPRTLGRLTLLSTIAQIFPHLNLPRQRDVAQRTIGVLAFLTALLALVLIPFDTTHGLPRWPLLIVLAVALWISSRADDVDDLLERFVLAAARIGSNDQRDTPLGRASALLRRRHQQARLAAASRKEATEAADAARLDEILHKLHEEGSDALSSEERAVLERVSTTLRELRAANGVHADQA